jgi:hypothetical protein
MVLVVFEYHLVLVEERIVRLLLLVWALLVVLFSGNDHSSGCDSRVVRWLERVTEVVFYAILFGLIRLFDALIAITALVLKIVNSGRVIPCIVTQESIWFI